VRAAASGYDAAMSDEPTKEGRPPEVAERTDPDTPQDPGIPGRKAEEEQQTGWEPSTPEHGFPEDAEDERAKREAAEADDTLPPGSMPPGAGS
jgi:hypothetical protein